ncbi:hypothetical protein GJT93_00345 [Enterobacteriaceae endosymbiont of Donacia provostii]|uniref:CvpA family protein n=1 Tax=Enterobacteriaceae endosymbiont of Donacia provostii TaxID=2675781 RepID=UPI001448FD16|nr:CvpA family protein [Enterobacteriaceae endosymbiont of Donacia provostii]QJC33565.1 hypothetical protein GJT93_00345 [Enterobacteriaceae endosymbiont of Donacia provostii]
MLIVNYVLIFILIYCSVISFYRGFINEVLTIIVWFISFYISKKYYHYIFVVKKINNFYFKKIFLLFFCFIFILIIGFTIKSYLNINIKNIYIKNINKILGLFFGLFKGFLIIFIFLYSIKHIDKEFYNYLIKKNNSLIIIIINNILQKYKYFL